MDEQREQQGLIIGRNAVTEALRSGRAIDSLLVAKGERGGSIGRIIAQCRENGVVIKETDKRKLDKLCGGENHQGVAAWAAVHEYSDVEDILENARSRGEQPFIIICDEIEDPHNLGAIIRTADACGAHGIIIPKRRGVALTYAVGKVSAGAVEYVPVARVANLPSLIDELKEKGFWIYGRGYGRHKVGRAGLFRRGRSGRRLRGQGDKPPCPREVRLHRVAPDEGQDQLAQRLGGGGHSDV